MDYKLIISSQEAESLRNLTRSEADVSGFMLYLNDHGGMRDMVVGTTITGEGNSGLFKHDEERLKSLEQMLGSIGAGIVEMHTHSEGTVKKFGESYAQDLSDDDRNAILETAKNEPEYRKDTYRHVLVTPVVMRLYSVKDGKVKDISEKLDLNPSTDDNLSIEEARRLFEDFASGYGLVLHRQ